MPTTHTSPYAKHVAYISSQNHVSASWIFKWPDMIWELKVVKSTVIEMLSFKGDETYNRWLPRCLIKFGLKQDNNVNLCYRSNTFEWLIVELSTALQRFHLRIFTETRECGASSSELVNVSVNTYTRVHSPLCQNFFSFSWQKPLQSKIRKYF